MNTTHPDCIRSLSPHERAALMDAAKAHAMQLRQQAFQDVAATLAHRARRIWRALFAGSARHEVLRWDRQLPTDNSSPKCA